MGQAVVRGGFDAYISQDVPNRSHPKAKYLKLQANERAALVYLKSPVPRGAKVESAILRVRVRGNLSESRQIAARRVIEEWKAGKVTWNNRPAVKDTSDRRANTGVAQDGKAVDIDVTPHIQVLANGGRHYGWQLTTPSDTLWRIYGFDAGENAPQLIVQWSDAPAEPTNLRPDGGDIGRAKPTVTFDYEDVSGSTELAAVQVQVSATKNGSSPDFDSGEYPTTEPELDLSATDMPGGEFEGLGENETTYWRIRAKDGAGLWSVWSEWAEVTYVPRQGVEIDYPVGSNPNMLANSDFELPLKLGETHEGGQWESNPPGALSVVEADDSMLGTRYAVLTNTDGRPAPNVQSEDITYAAVEEGETLTASGWFRWGGGSTSYTARLDIQFFDEADEPIGAKLGTAFTPSEDWQRVVTSGGVAPEGTDHAMIRVVLQNSTQGDKLHMDALQLERGSSPTPWKPAEDAAAAYVEDNSPTIVWTPGGPQAFWQVRITRANDRTHIIYDTGKRKGADTAHTIPNGVLRYNQRYSVNVRSWDTNDNRQASPGDPVFNFDWIDFDVRQDPTVDVVKNLTATPVGTTPWIDLEWERDSLPDSWTIEMDQREAFITGLEPEDTLVEGTGTKHRKRVLVARPNVAHRFNVRAVVNGKRSPKGKNVFARTSPQGIWIVDLDREINLVLWDQDEGEFEMQEEATVHLPMGASEPVRIVTGMAGMSGTLSGYLMETNLHPASFADQLRDLYRIKERPSQTVRIILADESFRAQIGNIVAAPTTLTRRGQRVKRVTLNFWQTGDLPYEPRI